eukprot:953959-Lingulodinium_polyedra.AAC.1
MHARVCFWRARRPRVRNCGRGPHPPCLFFWGGAAGKAAKRRRVAATKASRCPQACSRRTPAASKAATRGGSS